MEVGLDVLQLLHEPWDGVEVLNADETHPARSARFAHVRRGLPVQVAVSDGENVRDVGLCDGFPGMDFPLEFLAWVDVFKAVASGHHAHVPGVHPSLDGSLEERGRPQCELNPPHPPVRDEADGAVGHLHAGVYQVRSGSVDVRNGGGNTCFKGRGICGADGVHHGCGEERVIEIQPDAARRFLLAGTRVHTRVHGFRYQLVLLVLAQASVCCGGALSHHNPSSQF